MESCTSEVQDYQKESRFYKRISQKTKKALLRMILEEKLSLRYASKKLKLNLSTSRSILQRYRKSTKRQALTDKSDDLLQIKTEPEELSAPKTAQNQLGQGSLQNTSTETEGTRQKMNYQEPSIIPEKPSDCFQNSLQEMNALRQREELISYYYSCYQFYPFYQPQYTNQYAGWSQMHNGGFNQEK